MAAAPVVMAANAPMSMPFNPMTPPLSDCSPFSAFLIPALNPPVLRISSETMPLI